MLINNHRENMEERLNDEHTYLSKKYPNIAFNYYDWNGNINTGREYLYATEGYITVPKNYQLDTIKQFKGFLTPNRKFYEMYKNQANIIVTNGPLNSHNYYKIDQWPTYEERIKGIVSMNRMYHTGSEGDILHLRPKIINELPCEPFLIKHTYGPVPWGPHYQGYIKVHPNHEENLKICSKYLFILALEPMYHPIWSWDWATERILNAFKSKTVCVYFGCYNIEEIVPTDLFIDMRKFNNLTDLSSYLIAMSKSQWEDMTEKAYEWVQKTKWSDLGDLEQILASCK